MGNAFGCGSNWGDLDIIILPKLKDVAVYQFGVTQSGCPANNLNFRKTITLNQDSIVWATGHIISKQSGRRADLYLTVDGKRGDTHSSCRETQAVSLDAGLVGATWTSRLCLRRRAWQRTINPTQKVDVLRTERRIAISFLKRLPSLRHPLSRCFGHMIRNYNGRADLYLYRGNARLDLSLSYTAGKQWADVQLHHVGKLGKGKYTFSLRSNRANAFGCGTTWGDLDILVLPESV